MQKFKSIIFLVLIPSAGMLFSGCNFSDVGKKSEIQLEKNQAVSSEEEKVAVESNPATNTPSEADTLPASETANPKIADQEEVVTPPESAPRAEDVGASSPATSDKLKISDRLVDWGFTKSSGRKIDTIIVHSSYNAVGEDVHDLDDIIDREYKPAGVSPHYIISREGKIYRLVADKNIAYHAGVSKVPDGRTNVNDFSIGIEVVGTKSESPSSAQYSSLKKLISYLEGEYKIKYVLGHSDIAPGRKDDPWNFSWGKIK